MRVKAESASLAVFLRPLPHKRRRSPLTMENAIADRSPFASHHFNYRIFARSAAVSRQQGTSRSAFEIARLLRLMPSPLIQSRSADPKKQDCHASKPGDLIDLSHANLPLQRRP